MKRATPDEATKERAYLVRELIANLEIVKPEGDQATLRQRLCQRLYTELAQLTHSQVLRAYEALCRVQFPEQHAHALRDQLARRIGLFHHLKRVRSIEIPAAGGQGQRLSTNIAPGKPVCPHN